MEDELRLSLHARAWLEQSVLDAHVSGYCMYLQSRGYAPSTRRVYVGCVAHFAHWARGERLGLKRLDENAVARYLTEHLPQCGCLEPVRRHVHDNRAALVQLLAVLRSSGAVTMPCKPHGQIEAELERFDQYMQQARGLADNTRKQRVAIVRRLLSGAFGSRPVVPARLSPAGMRRFIVDHTDGWSAGSMHVIAGSLRGYLRFRASQGDRVQALLAAIPSIAHWRLAALPEVPTEVEIERLLHSFDQPFPSSRRAYAMVRCLVDLGLRSSEVVRLGLDDIDWQVGTVRLGKAKSRRVDILPLPRETGRAISSYLVSERAPGRVRHGLAEMIRYRALLIAAGYPDANDCDALRDDPAFKMAVGHLPETDPELCSQPTMCRLENLPTKTTLIRMMDAMVDLFCDSFAEVPRRILLDIDDTEDRVHGGQQLSLFNAHHDSHCFLPIHVYEATTGKPVAMILRPGKTPDGAEVARVLRHLVKAIRARWSKVEIVIRGDSHYARPEAMAWLERNRVGFIFGLAGNRVLLDRVADLREDAAVARAEEDADKVRRFGDFRYAAKSWKENERRVIARIEATRQGSDTRFIVTNLAGTPRWLYEALYCGRGQAENLIKAHKLHLASDRTSCSKATANQFRLLIHTAAYWLLHTLRDLAPKTSFWRNAQFDTLRLAFIKIAARVTELLTRIKVSLPSSYPYKPSLARFAGRARALPP